MKIGLMGGTFDPVHIGHLIAAQSAYEQAGLGEVWFMPANVPPHKQNKQGTDPAHRWAMIQLAIEGHSVFRATDIELRKGGVSYSIETVKLLRSEYPSYHFHYIIGADMVRYLPSWHKIDELAKLVSFIGLERPGVGTGYETLPPQIQAAVRMVRMPQMELSSTEIRSRAGEGLSIRYMVPDRVNEYIGRNRLYES